MKKKPEKRVKPYAKKVKGKRFVFLGEGGEARVWLVEGAEGTRKMGSVFRRLLRLKQKIMTKSEYKELLESARYVLEVQFLATKIAHELFPKNIIQVTGLDLEKMVVRSKFARPDKLLAKWRKLFARTTSLERRFKAHKEMSSPAFKKVKADWAKAKAEDHEVWEKVLKRSDYVGVKKKLRELMLAGFDLDPHAANISLRKPRQPLFYEVSSLTPKMVRRHMKRKKIPAKKKKKIEALLEEYEALG